MYDVFVIVFRLTLVEEKDKGFCGDHMLPMVVPTRDSGAGSGHTE